MGPWVQLRAIFREGEGCVSDVQQRAIEPPVLTVKAMEPPEQKVITMEPRVQLRVIVPKRGGCVSEVQKIEMDPRVLIVIAMPPGVQLRAIVPERKGDYISLAQVRAITQKWGGAIEAITRIPNIRKMTNFIKDSNSVYTTSFYFENPV